MSLRLRLIVAFFVLSVVPLGAVTYYTYRSNARAVREAAHDRCRDHARIGPRQREHVLADAVAVLDAEHPPIVSDPPCAPLRLGPDG